MSLVFAGVCSHAPGITGRAHMADPDVRDRFYGAFHQIEWQDYLQRMRDGIAAYGPVREGVYAMTTGLDDVVAPVHSASIEGSS